MKFIANPILWRMAVGLLAAAFAFIVGSTLIRRMRRSILQEGSLVPETGKAENLPLHAYNAVIQELKQQKHELQSSQQVERLRAKMTGNINAALLSNLPIGVIFFASNGLVRQANAAARRILGFNSLVGMSAAEIFRDASLLSQGPGQRRSLAAAIGERAQEDNPSNNLEAYYMTPAGQERMLEITMAAVHTESEQAVLGAACLIHDKTEMSHIQRQQDLQEEMSAEMGLKLRSSLSSISGYAREIAVSGDPQAVQQLATDILSEAAQLEHSFGGFLAEAKAARGTAD
jgi:PAS domain-containing protein